MECPTVRVKFDNEQGYYVINEADFDAAKHTLFTEPKPKPKPKTLQTEDVVKTEVAVKTDEPVPVAKTPDVGGVAPPQPWASKKDKP